MKRVRRPAAFLGAVVAIAVGFAVPTHSQDNPDFSRWEKAIAATGKTFLR